MRLGAPIALALLLIGCGTHGERPLRADRDSGADLELRFSLDVPAGESEAYLCHAFDASELDGAFVRSVRWSPPKGGATIHHAMLLATSEALPETTTPIACDPMPADAIGLHMWLPGGAALELPPDVGLELPRGVRTLIVQAHVLRLGDEPSGIASVFIARTSEPPRRIAARLGVEAPVPAIRPDTTEHSSSRCRFADAFHALYALPHMHRIGTEFHAARATSGGSVAFLDVTSWDFDQQRTYDTSVDFEPGDAVEMECTWQNSTTSYVLPGIYTMNEMCTLGLIGWPADAATCSYD